MPECRSTCEGPGFSATSFTIWMRTSKMEGRWRRGMDSSSDRRHGSGSNTLFSDRSHVSQRSTVSPRASTAQWSRQLSRVVGQNSSSFSKTSCELPRLPMWYRLGVDPSSHRHVCASKIKKSRIFKKGFEKNQRLTDVRDYRYSMNISRCSELCTS